MSWSKFFKNPSVATIAALYGVELLDEMVYGLQSAVLPQIKSDLALSYTEIGILISLPGVIGIVGAPVIGLMGDTRHRRALVISGIVATALGLMLTGIAQSFVVLLLAFCILYVASDAYVNLPQATLIDRDPARAEQTMARWTVLGHIGVTISPLIVTGLFYFGYGWRGLYLSLAAVAGLYTALLMRQSFTIHAGAERKAHPREMWNDLASALRNRELVHWVIVAEFAELMLDKLLEQTGLYFHDVVGVDFAAASAAVAVSTLAGLVGGVLLVPALEKFRGLVVLRLTALAALGLYIAWLIVPIVWLKFVLIGAVSFCTASWFPILRGNTYTVLPGKSGLIVSITALGNVISFSVPFVVGTVADAFGLEWAMWLFVIGPIALLVGLPREEKRTRKLEEEYSE